MRRDPDGTQAKDNGANGPEQSGSLQAGSDPNGCTGLARAPEASENLRKVVEMVNQRNPDAVIVTGDIGERESAWDEAKKIFAGLKPKVFYVPGNYDNFDQKKASPLSANAHPETERMLGWLEKEGGKDESAKKYGGAESERPQRMDDEGHGKLIFAMQHEPIDRSSEFPPDDKDYWIIQEPYRSREIDLLHRLGVKHMFVGHWHKGVVFSAHDITSHVAPATSWSGTGDKLGFAMHTITPDGDVKTEFVYLEGADPHAAN